MGWIKGLIDPPHSNPLNGNESQHQKQHLPNPISDSAQTHSQKQSEEPDPDSPFDGQSQHTPAKRRRVADQRSVLSQSDGLAVGLCSAETHGHGRQSHCPCGCQRRQVRCQTQCENQRDQQTGHHRPGLMAILPADSPTHSSSQGRHQYCHESLRGSLQERSMNEGLRNMFRGHENQPPILSYSCPNQSPTPIICFCGRAGLQSEDKSTQTVR